MRIGIDARELSGRATGVGRYLSGLLHEWARPGHEAGRHEFVLYAAAAIGAELDARRFGTRLIPGAPGTWWEQVRLPRAIPQDHLDVWFGPAYTAPLSLNLPTVVTIHDVSFAAHPEWFRLREGLRRRWLTEQSAQRARAVVTVSEFSKREIVEHLGIAAGKIHVIPQGIGAVGLGLAPSRRQSASPAPPAHAVTASPQPLAPSALLTASPETPAPSPYRVLYVGSIFNRRHVTDLIRAFAPIARERLDTSLDIVGDNRSYPREDIVGTIAREGLERQVRCHEYVSEAELRDLYVRARAFAFLSEYEGLGMTPLEALAAGVPPVLLDTAVARESCREAAVFVPPNDLRAVTRALASLLFDEAVRARVLTAAPAALSIYSWPKAARETLAVLEHAGSG
jgi:glycosyltransferase involved in cell wall biosynthesis